MARDVIEVIGSPASDEYATAVSIRNALVGLWPGIQDTPREEDHILIAANAKLSGYKISDIDVVVGAALARKRYFVPRRPLRDPDGKMVSGTKIRVRSLVVAIEVKGQDAQGVRIDGDEVNVRYRGNWKSASQQNIDQLHALRHYFSDQHIDAWIYRCLVMNGLASLPVHSGQLRPASGAVALGFSGADLLTAIAGVNNLRRWGNEFALSSAKQEQMPRVLGASIFKRIVPSRLDRARMDRISARPAEAGKIAALLGQQRVHVRGHGGTGKTVLMLQAAHEAYQRHGKRCLVLTYNRALAADIQRIMALLRVPGRAEGGGIEVRTAMSFIYAWLNRLGVLKADETDDYESYSTHCAEALEAFGAGALNDDDVAKAIASDEQSFAFDAIIVDEAQDWPQSEANLLARIYGGNRIALADGLDQLVRGLPTNWKRTLPVGTPSDDKNLVECLRMKRNLGVFANAVAAHAGLNWTVEPNGLAAGGNVVFLFGSYAQDGMLQARLLDESREAKNEKIDFLHCVPASNIVEKDGHRQSQLGIAMVSAGQEVWDGVDPAVRQEFPRSVDVLRVVQYDSCRGLEGWIAVLEWFDEFWQAKYEGALAAAKASKDYQGSSPEDLARVRAWRWAMIPLTRPIDTLVISLRDGAGETAKLLLDVAATHPDFVSIEGARTHA